MFGKSFNELTIQTVKTFLIDSKKSKFNFQVRFLNKKNCKICNSEKLKIIFMLQYVRIVRFFYFILIQKVTMKFLEIKNIQKITLQLTMILRNKKTIRIYLEKWEFKYFKFQTNDKFFCPKKL